jgi:hypothetical protein
MLAPDTYKYMSGRLYILLKKVCAGENYGVPEKSKIFWGKEGELRILVGSM